MAIKKDSKDSNKTALCALIRNPVDHQNGITTGMPRLLFRHGDQFELIGNVNARGFVVRQRAGFIDDDRLFFTLGLDPG